MIHAFSFTFKLMKKELLPWDKRKEGRRKKS